MSPADPTPPGPASSHRPDAPAGSDAPADPGAPAGLDAEAFRAAAHAAVDWIADYLAGVGDRPVRPAVEPGGVRALLPAHPPSDPEPWAAVVADLDRVIVPNLTHWQHPRFFAYFPANASYASILGEMVSAGLGVNGMLWATSPAATELETRCLDWFAELLDLPERFRSEPGPGGGMIQGTASEATLCALLAARERALEGAGNRTGLRGGPELVAYATAQAHSSIEKAARIAGVGSANLRVVAHDDAFAMRPDALADAMAADRAAGRLPFFVVASHGTTSSMAIDPTPAIAEVAAGHGAWLHVDAAMAGVAALCPELRWVNAGLEHADSYCTNPHKWMGVVFDCDTFWVADRRHLTNALGILPEYLKTAHTGAVIDYRDWQIPLGRRFRALKLWFALRLGDVADARGMIRRHLTLTEELVAWFAGHPRFRIVAPPRLNLVCVAHVDGDDATRALVERANATGEVLLTPTVLDGTASLRVCIGGRTTTAADVDRLRALLDRLA